MRRLGVLGTFVWDTIRTLEDQAAGRAFETWGGLGYSLAAAAAIRPAGWEVVPLVKVGADLADEARAFMDALPGIAAGEGVLVVPEPNNRVELVYTDVARRGERLTGGVPAWTWEELAPRVAGLDALYVNFFSGFEMGVEAAEGLRDGFRAPLYADLHSLFLGSPGAGARQMRRLPDWARWAACFDAVQLNEDELRMLAQDAGGGTFAEVGARVLEEGPWLAVVTRGGDGVAYVAREGDAVRSAEVAPLGGTAAGDPTGAGDVWGVTFFAALLEGLTVEDAVRRALGAAERKLSFRGATGLYEHLVAAEATRQGE